jgi:hypothetical protein
VLFRSIIITTDTVNNTLSIHGDLEALVHATAGAMDDKGNNGFVESLVEHSYKLHSIYKEKVDFNIKTVGNA